MTGVFYGLCTFDVVHFVDDLPGYNAKARHTSFYSTIGGPATNAAITYALMGGNAKLNTAIGTGALARTVAAELEARHITFSDFAAADFGDCPCASIFVRNTCGGRSIVGPPPRDTYPCGAKPLEAMLDGASFLLVDGYYGANLPTLLEIAHRSGIPTILDAGSWKEGTEQWLPWIETVIASADFRPPGGPADFELARWLQSRGVKRIAITRGELSILARDEAGQEHAIDVVKVDRVVDTLGAGDVLHGAYAWFSYDIGQSFLEALSSSSRVATNTVRFADPRRGVEEWIKRA